MNNIISYIFSIITIILIMTIINIILFKKKKINHNYKYFINGILLIIIALTINQYNNIISLIFKLKLQSVKFYIIILIIVNIITLKTINKKIKQKYKVINFLLFSLMLIMLIAIIAITLAIKLRILNQIYSKYSVNLVNISIITFIIYTMIISIIYIVSNIKLKKTNKEKKKENILTKEELLKIKDKSNFFINGVDCSIIFEDSINENIIKNYHILLNDINDKLVTGYTLDENKMLKSICIKLNTNKLNYIDLNNLSILNKISLDEYNLLKQINEK